MYYSPSSYLELPEEPGIYLFLNDKNEVLYVGKARNLKNRVSSYFGSKSNLLEKTKLLVAHIVKIKIILVTSEIESLLLEAAYIKKYRPWYNRKLLDDKAYPLIKVTRNELYPAVLLSRREDDPKALYFGPFPNAGEMKMALKTIRRIFPYHSVAHHPKRACLYHHMGLCPCLPAFDTPENRQNYKKTLRRIIHFLDGDTKNVIKDLERERDQLAKDEEFEKAQQLQRKIDAITNVTQKVAKPFEYEINPNLRTDIRLSEMKDLQEKLATVGVHIELPSRIECFDISNIQGYNSVGSMVVLTNAEKDTSQYRRFKIKTVKNGMPNDFASMKEVLKRRLRHEDWPYPQLLVVDGGKGQISSAWEVLQELNIHLPLVGLAKREETIITPDFQELHLPKSSQALQLVMRIRDEAHRFAITYHRKLRGKSALATV